MQDETATHQSPLEIFTQLGFDPEYFSGYDAIHNRFQWTFDTHEPAPLELDIRKVKTAISYSRSYLVTSRGHPLGWFETYSQAQIATQKLLLVLPLLNLGNNTS